MAASALEPVEVVAAVEVLLEVALDSVGEEVVLVEAQHLTGASEMHLVFRHQIGVQALLLVWVLAWVWVWASVHSTARFAAATPQSRY